MSFELGSCSAILNAASEHDGRTEMHVECRTLPMKVDAAAAAATAVAELRGRHHDASQRGTQRSISTAVAAALGACRRVDTPPGQRRNTGMRQLHLFNRMPPRAKIAPNSSSSSSELTTGKNHTEALSLEDRASNGRGIYLSADELPDDLIFFGAPSLAAYSAGTDNVAIADNAQGNHLSGGQSDNVRVTQPVAGSAALPGLKLGSDCKHSKHGAISVPADEASNLKNLAHGSFAVSEEECSNEDLDFVDGQDNTPTPASSRRSGRVPRERALLGEMLSGGAWSGFAVKPQAALPGRMSKHQGKLASKTVSSTNKHANPTSNVAVTSRQESKRSSGHTRSDTVSTPKQEDEVVAQDAAVAERQRKPKEQSTPVSRGNPPNQSRSAATSLDGQSPPSLKHADGSTDPHALPFQQKQQLFNAPSAAADTPRSSHEDGKEEGADSAHGAESPAGSSSRGSEANSSCHASEAGRSSRGSATKVEHSGRTQLHPPRSNGDTEATAPALRSIESQNVSGRHSSSKSRSNSGSNSGSGDEAASLGASSASSSSHKQSPGLAEAPRTSDTEANEGRTAEAVKSPDPAAAESLADSDSGASSDGGDSKGSKSSSGEDSSAGESSDEDS